MKVQLISVTPDAEKVIEKAARTCYMSHGRITKDSHAAFIKRLIGAGHLSVLEHATATFSLEGVSRALTHQLVRHRLCSYSQQSQRYVREDNFQWVVPPDINKDEKLKKEYNQCMEYLRDRYSSFLKNGLKAEDARFILPNACCTNIVFSANFRQLRHTIALRGSSKAQWEIRDLFMKITLLMKEVAPNCFFDFNIDTEKNVIQTGGADV